MGKIENAMSQRREEIQDEINRKKAHEQRARDLSRQEELRDKEREMWEEKFYAYLFESVGPKVRDRIAYLKPGTVG